MIVTLIEDKYNRIKKMKKIKLRNNYNYKTFNPHL